MKQLKASIKRSTCSSPRSEPGTVASTQTSVSTPLHPTDSASLEEAQPPAPENGPSSLDASVPKPAPSCEDSAATSGGDVFSAEDWALSALDSPHKEFHGAVLRALVKHPPAVQAAEGGQAAGTTDKAEIKLWAVLSLPCSSQACLTTYPLTGILGIPACCFLSSLRVWSLLPLFHHVPAPSSPTFHL